MVNAAEDAANLVGYIIESRKGLVKRDQYKSSNNLQQAERLAEGLSYKDLDPPTKQRLDEVFTDTLDFTLRKAKEFAQVNAARTDEMLEYIEIYTNVMTTMGVPIPRRFETAYQEVIKDSHEKYVQSFLDATQQALENDAASIASDALHSLESYLTKHSLELPPEIHELRTAVQNLKARKNLESMLTDAHSKLKRRGGPHLASAYSRLQKAERYANEKGLELPEDFQDLIKDTRIMVKQKEMETLLLQATDKLEHKGTKAAANKLEQVQAIATEETLELPSDYTTLLNRLRQLEESNN